MRVELNYRGSRALILFLDIRLLLPVMAAIIIFEKQLHGDTMWFVYHTDA
jgi:hypothetical protein